MKAVLLAMSLLQSLMGLASRNFAWLHIGLGMACLGLAVAMEIYDVRREMRKLDRKNRK